MCPHSPHAPVLVETTRGPAVESLHRGAALVVDRNGSVKASWGDIDRPVFARSAIKSLQALPLVETGAADAFSVTDEELALASASHNGEDAHTSRVAAWLKRIGLGEADLECGIHRPYDQAVTDRLIASGEAPSQLHNNCSGKHAGFLTTALHMGEPTKGYIEREHPVQQRILGVLEQMTGHSLGAAPWGRDGCSIPTVAIPLSGLAFAMARMADPMGLPERRVEAVLRVRQAWGRHPHLVGGTGRFDTEIMTATAGRVLTKGGAEGVFCAALPDYGLGVALKIDDGAERAAEVAITAILDRIGALDDLDQEVADRLRRRAIKSRRGFPAGEIRPCVDAFDDQASAV